MIVERLEPIGSSIIFALVLMAASVSIVWAQDAGTGNETSSNASENVTIAVTAQGMAFNTSTITVPAGANVTIIFNNQDSGIPHNIAFYETSAAKDQIYVGEIINGPRTVNYNFTAPSTPGTYFFRCDVHPSMRGDFIVT